MRGETCPRERRGRRRYKGEGRQREREREISLDICMCVNAMVFPDLFYVFVELLRLRRGSGILRPRPPTPLGSSKTFTVLYNYLDPGFHGPATPTPTPRLALAEQYTCICVHVRSYPGPACACMHAHVCECIVRCSSG